MSANPSSIDYYNEALDALQAGNAPEALAGIVNSLTEDPNDVESWKLYVLILNALGRTEEARKAGAKLAGMGISEVEGVLMKAAASLGEGDLEGGISHYEAALAIEPDRAEVHGALALALMEKGDSEKALAAARTAVGLDPEDAHSQYALGRVLRLTEKKEEALEALTKAVSLDPEFMMALYEQGMLLAEKGEFQAALGNFEKFRKAHPRDPSVLQAIAGIRERLGQGR